MLYHAENPHGGDVYGTEIELDFSSNVNPLGMPPGVAAAMRAAVEEARRYPDPYCRELTAAIAAYENVPERTILCGAGAAELIWHCCDALRPRRAALLAPTFSEYEAAAAHFGAEIVRYPLRAPEFMVENGLLPFLERMRPELLFLCSPNNPTGRTISRALLEQVLRLGREIGMRVVLDECFLDFTEAASAKELLGGNENLLILKAFTKNFALAGVRVGYCMTQSGSWLERMAACAQPWNVSLPSQAAGVAALRQPDWPARARAFLPGERTRMTREMEKLGFQVCPSEANYLLFSAPVGLDAALRREKIAIRNCENYPGLGPGWYRVAVRRPEENGALLAAMRRVMEEDQWR